MSIWVVISGMTALFVTSPVLERMQSAAVSENIGVTDIRIGSLGGSPFSIKSD